MWRASQPMVWGPLPAVRSRLTQAGRSPCVEPSLQHTSLLSHLYASGADKHVTRDDSWSGWAPTPAASPSTAAAAGGQLQKQRSKLTPAGWEAPPRSHSLTDTGSWVPYTIILLQGLARARRQPGQLLATSAPEGIVLLVSVLPGATASCFPEQWGAKTAARTC